MSFITNIFNSFHNYFYSNENIDTTQEELLINTNTENNDTNEEYNNYNDSENLSTIFNKKCGYCKEIGHNVKKCNNQNVYVGRCIINNFINRRHLHINSVNEWLKYKSDLLLKAIMCNSNTLRFSENYTRLQIELKIKYYIESKRLLINLTPIIKNSTENYYITNAFNYYVSDIPPRDMDIINRNPQNNIEIELSMEELCDKLYITPIVFLNIIKNKSIECPICMENTECMNIRQSNCEHEFCINCIEHMLKKNIQENQVPTCPLCRTIIYTIAQNE
jgi:hypothetical protein